MTRPAILAFLFFVLFVRGQEPPADGGLARVRRVNLERAAHLPDFVADETAVRYNSRHSEPPAWKYVDTIESEIAVQGGSQFSRRQVRVNGQPWKKKEFEGWNWSVQFGGELKPLFNPTCPTRIEYDGRDEVRGKPVVAYRFSSPPNGCFGYFSIKSGFLSAMKRYNPAQTGRFLVDEPEGNVIQFKQEAHEFPKGFDADAWAQTITWDYVKTGDGTYLLPVAVDMLGGFTKGELWHVTVEYKNHRHFKASTSVTFHQEEGK